MGVFDGYRITNVFGWTTDPFDRNKRIWHTGIDLVKSHKAPIEAFTEGVVLFAGEGLSGTGFGGYGNVVLIQDKNNRGQVYAHLHSVAVKKGSSVKKGQIIGYQGSTGKVTGSHLHYEVRKKAMDKPPYGWEEDRVNNCLNPTEYLENFYQNEEKYTVVKEINGYYTAANARDRKDPRTKVKPGEYLIFNKYNDTLINVTKTRGVPGAWINTEDNVVEQKNKILILPATAESWRVYPLNKPPTVGNEIGYLRPKKFGGLTYEILATPLAHVVTIQTRDFGKVNIYVHPSTGAQIK